MRGSMSSSPTSPGGSPDSRPRAFSEPLIRDSTARLDAFKNVGSLGGRGTQIRFTGTGEPIMTRSDSASAFGLWAKIGGPATPTTPASAAGSPAPRSTSFGLWAMPRDDNTVNQYSATKMWE